MALKEIPGWAENGKMQFAGARDTFGGEIRTPQKFLPESAHLCYILHFGQPDPHGREILGHFGPGRPLALREIPGGKQKNTNTLIETEKKETNPIQLGPNTQS